MARKAVVYRVHVLIDEYKDAPEGGMRFTGRAGQRILNCSMWDDDRSTPEQIAQNKKLIRDAVRDLLHAEDQAPEGQDRPDDASQGRKALAVL